MDLQTKKYIFLLIIIFDPSFNTKDHPDAIACGYMGNFIGHLNRVKHSFDSD